MDDVGYVRLDHLLAWRGLNKFQPRVEAEDIFESVRASDKQRFGLKYTGRDTSDGADTKPEEHASAAEVASEDRSGQEPSNPASPNETQRALAIWDAGTDPTPTHYFIRANQGHSIKGVAAEGLLTPINPDDPASVPACVVHGTFYGAWEAICQTGRLRPMSRNHIHFSSGPRKEDALGQVPQDNDGGGGGGGGGGGDVDDDTTSRARRPPPGRLGALMAEAKVVSGMRRDAEVLIYIDIAKALRAGMSWWRSENGVILTGGLDGEGDHSGGVPSEFWDAVVEVKEGLGLLWADGVVVQELPARLRGRPLPMGKGRGGSRGGGGGRGRGGKPRARDDARSDDAESPAAHADE